MEVMAQVTALLPEHLQVLPPEVVAQPIFVLAEPLCQTGWLLPAAAAARECIQLLRRGRPSAALVAALRAATGLPALQVAIMVREEHNLLAVLAVP